MTTPELTRAPLLEMNQRKWHRTVMLKIDKAHDR